MEKLIGLEEHLVTKDIAAAWMSDAVPERDRNFSIGTLCDKLTDLGESRLAAMDDQGVDVQVLSVTAPGVQNLAADLAIPLARSANDLVAEAVKAHPARFDGFATRPTPDPRAAGDELRRAVNELGFKGALLNGRTGAMNIDHPDMDPVWSAAAELRSPIYLHPQLPVTEVRDAYYSGFGSTPDWILGGPMMGWHFETGMQLLRLVLAGTFDRYPDLQVIVGHWGEVVLFFLERVAEMQEASTRFPLERPVFEYFRQNVSFTGSGLLSDRYLRWTKEMVGTKRILYATDYPFIDTGEGKARSFLEESDLTEEEREDIAHRNWERLTAHLV